MKTVLIIILIFVTAEIFYSQTSDSDLNGKIFRGTAIEETPPNVDRRPMSYDELISFENGKMFSEVLKIYSADESSYSSFVDDRRMVAVKVVEFNSSTTGTLDGRNVEIEYKGSIYADAKLSGDIIIKYPDGNELKFNVYACAE